MSSHYVKSDIEARKISFDFSKTSIYWAGSPFITHATNPLHMLLPPGELWFCRVFNNALSEITYPQLYQDVKGFIGQEATHAKSHNGLLEFYKENNIDLSEYVKSIDLLFKNWFEKKPFNKQWLNPILGKKWLLFQVGMIAAIEHFTAVLGMWVLEEDRLNDIDQEVLRLIRWHGAEEVEHREIAFKLFKHLCETKIGFYFGRQLTMAIVLPIFIIVWGRAIKYSINQDQILDKNTIPTTYYKILKAIEKESKITGKAPSLKYLLASVIRWGSPFYNPKNEGNDQIAKYYFQANSF